MEQPTTNGNGTRLVVLWESLGPYHHDRLRELARGGFEIDVIELHEQSRDYQWERDSALDYRIHTIVPAGARTNGLLIAARIIRICWRSKARAMFFCHYEKMGVFVSSLVLRLARRRVFTMIDSKFDDYPRVLWRELIKSLYLRPYSGALVASARSRDYVRFLGFGQRPVQQGYDTIDIARFSRIADDGTVVIPHDQRPFLVVARLVPKKNIAEVLRAFALHLQRHGAGRELHIIGYGPMEAELVALAAELGIAPSVRFLGARPSSEVADAMIRSVALILASTEEQFGLVINEALAMGTPVIVSSNAGAVDELVDNDRNGIIVNPRDTAGISHAMSRIATMPELEWTRMSAHARDAATRGDVRHFRSGVERLLDAG